MTETVNYSIEKSALFDKKRFVFLGESIHGVSEFARMRLEIARRYFSERSVLVFEADSKGMLLSHQHNDDANLRLKNFPKILRTQEMLNLLSWAISRQIPCFGIDCIPRRELTDISSDLYLQRQREITDYLEAKSTLSFFEWRDARMAENLSGIASAFPEHRMLIMLHNLHIKRCGSQEYAELRLKSVREHFDSLFPGQSHSIAQIARSGDALHNDLSPFHFQINDPFSLETYSGSTLCTLLVEEHIPENRIAWHHAFERETVPVKKQYEGCFIFKSVHAPLPR